jgi:hypothetical protein
VEGQTDYTNNVFAPMTLKMTAKLHDLMAKAVATSPVPLRFLENPFFVEYQKLLAGRKYSVPDRKTIVNSVLPMIHGSLLSQKMEELDKLDGVTACLDGWKDVCGKSIYACMLLVIL